MVFISWSTGTHTLHCTALPYEALYLIVTYLSQEYRGCGQCSEGCFPTLESEVARERGKVRRKGGKKGRIVEWIQALV